MSQWAETILSKCVKLAKNNVFSNNHPTSQQKMSGFHTNFQFSWTQECFLVAKTLCMGSGMTWQGIIMNYILYEHP